MVRWFWTLDVLRDTILRHRLSARSEVGSRKTGVRRLLGAIFRLPIAKQSAKCWRYNSRVRGRGRQKVAKEGQRDQRTILNPTSLYPARHLFDRRCLRPEYLISLTQIQFPPKESGYRCYQRSRISAGPELQWYSEKFRFSPVQQKTFSCPGSFFHGDYRT